MSKFRLPWPITQLAPFTFYEDEAAALREYYAQKCDEHLRDLAFERAGADWRLLYRHLPQNRR